MRILNVVGWLAPRYGGTVAVINRVVPLLERRGHYVEVWTTNADGMGVLPVATGRPIRWQGMTVTFHSLSHPKAYLVSWDMVRTIRQRIAEFDVVHIHSLYRFHTLVTSRIAKNRGVPYVIQAHGALDPWNRGRRRRAKSAYHALIEDAHLNGAAAIVCTSAQEEEGMRKLGYKGRIRVVPLGVDVPDAPKSETPDDQFLTLMQPDRKLITFVGRISPVKGVDLLVESFGAVSRAFPQAHLVVAGPDQDGNLSGVRRSVASKGLSERVSFLGPVTSTTRDLLLQRSSVFVLPSAGESFGLAVSEAMAAGCPVVVTPRVAIQDIVTRAGAGVVAERSVLGIAEAINVILSDPKAAAAMGRAGRRAMREGFSWDAVAGEMESLYRSLVAS